MPSGGAGRGQGRKKGHKASHTIKTENARAYLIEQVVKDLEPIVSAQKEAAKGLYYENAKGKIYQREPDLKAGEYLLNQAAGKARETVEVHGDMILKINV